jgi:aminoglycoside 6'-N-acetyltransferase I
MLSLVHLNDLNASDYLAMVLQLWPDFDTAELTEMLERNGKDAEVAYYLCRTDKNEYVGFINLSLRHDYVEGCTTNPVGFIEGIFVKSEFRKQGVGAFMVAAGEHWARSKGCIEYASDTNLDNIDSQLFHQRLGFINQATVVHFWKKIES